MLEGNESAGSTLKSHLKSGCFNKMYNKMCDASYKQ